MIHEEAEACENRSWMSYNCDFVTWGEVGNALFALNLSNHLNAEIILHTKMLN